MVKFYTFFGKFEIDLLQVESMRPQHVDRLKLSSAGTLFCYLNFHFISFCCHVLKLLPGTHC